MLDPRCGAILDGHDLNKLESQQYRDDFVGKDEMRKVYHDDENDYDRQRTLCYQKKT